MITAILPLAYIAVSAIFCKRQHSHN